MPKEWDGIVSQNINRKISKPTARFLVAHTKITPNQMTVLGFLVAVLSGICFSLFHGILGGILAQLSSILDGVDGDIAILTGKTSVFGGFLDSILDRYGDCVILIAMIYNVLFTYENVLIMVAVAIAALFGSAMVSYSRARAESDLNVIFKSGFSGYAANRDVRLFIIMIGGILNQIFASLLLLALLTNAVVLKRIYDSWKISPNFANT